jgi:hypothetical protein
LVDAENTGAWQDDRQSARSDAVLKLLRQLASQASAAAQAVWLWQACRLRVHSDDIHAWASAQLVARTGAISNTQTIATNMVAMFVARVKKMPL